MVRVFYGCLMSSSIQFLFWFAPSSIGRFGGDSFSLRRGQCGGTRRTTLYSPCLPSGNRTWILACVRIVERFTVQLLADGSFYHPATDGHEVVVLRATAHHLIIGLPQR